MLKVNSNVVQLKGDDVTLNIIKAGRSHLTTVVIGLALTITIWLASNINNSDAFDATINLLSTIFVITITMWEFSKENPENKRNYAVIASIVMFLFFIVYAGLLFYKYFEWAKFATSFFILISTLPAIDRALSFFRGQQNNTSN